MKRIFSYMAMLLVAGCTMDHKNEYDPSMKLMFQPVMHVASKAVTGENYPAGQPFAINAWTSDGQTYISGGTVAVDEEGAWTLEDGTLWPDRSKRLTVIGYTPAEAFTSCTDTEGVTCTYDILQSQTDLLYSDPQEGLDKVECGGIVFVPFRHALCQVDFKVKNRVAKDEEIIIKSIKVDGIKPEGSFHSLPEPEWKADGDPVEVLFFEGGQSTRNVPDRIGTTWFIVPQALNTNVSVEYEYRTASDTGFTTTIKTCALQTNLKPGRHYTYTLSVGIDDVKFLLEIIEDRFK